MFDFALIWQWFIDHLELIITAIAFGFTIYEIRRTKNSVEASRAATEQTIQLMSERSTIADITLIQGSLREVQVALRGMRYEAGLIRLQTIREKLNELRDRKGFTSEGRRTEIQDMVLNLTKLENRLERKLANPNLGLSVPNANNLLGNFMNELSQWNDVIRFQERSSER